MYDENNVFAKIIRGEIPCNKVYEDEKVLAFYDISPAAPKHILVIPKGKYESIADFALKAGNSVVADFFAQVTKIAEALGLNDSGYRIISNHGKDAHQTVPHFHVHILGGKPLGALIAGDSKLR